MKFTRTLALTGLWLVIATSSLAQSETKPVRTPNLSQVSQAQVDGVVQSERQPKATTPRLVNFNIEGEEFSIPYFYFLGPMHDQDSLTVVSIGLSLPNFLPLYTDGNTLDRTSEKSPRRMSIRISKNKMNHSEDFLRFAEDVSKINDERFNRNIKRITDPGGTYGFTSAYRNRNPISGDIRDSFFHFLENGELTDFMMCSTRNPNTDGRCRLFFKAERISLDVAFPKTGYIQKWKEIKNNSEEIVCNFHVNQCGK